jgi:hypothetical protein
MEMSVGNGDDLPEASDEVGKQPPSHQLKIRNVDVSGTDQACEDGVQLDDAEGRKEVMRPEVCQECLTAALVSKK